VAARSQLRDSPQFRRRFGRISPNLRTLLDPYLPAAGRSSGPIAPEGQAGEISANPLIPLFNPPPGTGG